jgi:hypothetical protein
MLVVFPDLAFWETSWLPAKVRTADNWEFLKVFAANIRTVLHHDILNC